jgi:hypothetical protein
VFVVCLFVVVVAVVAVVAVVCVSSKVENQVKLKVNILLLTFFDFNASQQAKLMV